MLTSSLYLPFLVHGILLMLLGVAAIASPNVATMTVGGKRRLVPTFGMIG